MYRKLRIGKDGQGKDESPQGRHSLLKLELIRVVETMTPLTVSVPAAKERLL